MNAGLVVYERRGDWAAALRSLIDAPGKRLVETRSLQELEQAIDDAPESVAAVEVGPENLAPMLRWFSSCRGRRPAVVLAALLARPEGPSAAPGLEWHAAVADALREASAAFVAHSPRDLPDFARWCSVHLAGRPAARQSLSDQILSNLPW